MDISVFLRGLLIGFSIAAPVGPIGVLCIRRTVAEGRLVGFLSGAGAATADAFYGAVAAFGLAAVSNLLIQHQANLQLAGGLFLIYLGLRTFFSKPATTAAKTQTRPANLFGAYASTLALTLTNPLTILSFLAIFAGLGAAGDRETSALVIIAGVFSGSLLWWFILSFLAGMLQKYLAGPRLVWLNRISGLIISFFALTILFSWFTSFQTPQTPAAGNPGAPPPPGQSNLPAAGFARADRVRAFSFPEDFGPHPEFQTEWWYYTGNLSTAQGRRFGYQLTFFRRSIEPVGERVERASHWATDQVYLAHFALTDVAGGEHYAFERLSRGAVGLAGVTAAPFQVWLEDWQVTQTADRQYRLQAGVPESENAPAFALDLVLDDAKGPILQGDHGYSQKGADPGNASYYYSLTRIATNGSITLNGQLFAVQGSSWMDHEYSTSALGASQVGWDWFSIQLENNQELMLFQLRNADGSVDSFSTAALIAADGSVTRFSAQEFKIKVTSKWTSPVSKAVYPAGWQIDIPTAGITLALSPVIANQEMDLQYRYWEGAVDVRGTVGGIAVKGVGYVELTGYAQSLQGEF